MLDHCGNRTFFAGLHSKKEQDRAAKKVVSPHFLELVYLWSASSQAGYQPGGATARPIAATLLVAGDAFVAVTNSGKIAKVLVTANSGGFSATGGRGLLTWRRNTCHGLPLWRGVLKSRDVALAGFHANYR
jgi:hypothetical protein